MSTITTNALTQFILDADNRRHEAEQTFRRDVARRAARIYNGYHRADTIRQPIDLNDPHTWHRLAPYMPEAKGRLRAEGKYPPELAEWERLVAELFASLPVPLPEREPFDITEDRRDAALRDYAAGMRWRLQPERYPGSLQADDETFNTLAAGIAKLDEQGFVERFMDGASEPEPDHDWMPREGYVGVKAGYAYNGKRVSRQTIADWTKRDRVRADKDPKTGECHYDENWLLSRCAKWKPRSKSVTRTVTGP